MQMTIMRVSQTAALASRTFVNTALQRRRHATMKVVRKKRCIALGPLLTLTCLVMANVASGDAVKGAWLSPPEDNWPLIPVHAALTPDGRVLLFGSDADGNQTGFFNYDVWDPAEGLSGGHVTLENMTLTDIFCSYALILPDGGDVLIAGGDNWTGTSTTNKGNRNSTTYRSTDGVLSRGNDMNRARWYATATPLMNGEIYIQGGKGGADFPEVRAQDGTYRLLSGAPTGTFNYYYPRNFLAPDGRVFGIDILGKWFRVATDGVGSVVATGQFDSTYFGRPSTTAMFRPGKILQIVGKNKKAIVIDINGEQPVVTPTKPLSAKRVWGNATILADGRVLTTGGSGQANQLINVNNKAEIWNPQTGKWTVGASGLRPRLYHSIALLLPDASVLVGGGGANPDGPVNNLHSEIYYPPYLFNTEGGLASRPNIESAPDSLMEYQAFSMQVTSSGIARVTLVQAGAVTHSINLQQRFIELSFAADGDTLFVDMPVRVTDAPPGYYLLFAIDANGVPSHGKMVRVNRANSG